MNRVLFSALTVVFAPVAIASPEQAVQGRSDLGGGPTEIRGRLAGQTGWSLTGRASDVASVFDRTGRRVARVAIGSFRLGANGSVFVSDIVRLADGQTRIFAWVLSTGPQFNGGRVELRRGSATGPVADSDPIRL